MIAAHPFTGIGWGNYGNLRNSPEYRGASLFVAGADEPGLGIFGTAADLGLPLLAFLLFCLFVPVFYVRGREVQLYVLNLALWQPISHIFGSQLNLTYPWITTALALGLAYSRQQRVPPPERPLSDLSPAIEATR
jgi:O-antigen ligase